MFTALVTFNKYTPNDFEKAGAEVPSKQKGFIRLRRAIQIQDPTVGYWIVDFETKEDHDAFLSSEEGMKHVASTAQWSESVAPVQGYLGPTDAVGEVFSAHVVEVTIITLREDNKESRQKLHELIAGVKAAIKETPTAHNSLSGDLVEFPGMPCNPGAFLFVGWNSVEAFEATISQEKHKYLFELLSDIGEAKMKHIKLI